MLPLGENSTHLILRGPEMREFDALAAFFADPDRAWGFGGAETRPEAWRWWASNIGHWHIHGYGYFTIEDKASGAPAGPNAATRSRCGAT